MLSCYHVKNRKVKNGIHPEKTKGKKKEEAVEKVKA